MNLYDLTYAGLCKLGSCISRHDFRVKGVEMPSQAVIASTHACYLDAPALVFGLGKPISFFSAKPHFPGMGYIISRDRSEHDMLEEAASFVGSGYSLGIFPQGRRFPEGQIGELKRGVFYYARHFNLPLVPVAIKGAEVTWPNDAAFPYLTGQVVLNVGKPFEFNGKGMKDRCDALRGELQQLYENA